MELHEALTLRRKTIKMSFEDLSNKTNISISTLKKVFTGITANPAYETVRAIAHAMGITTDDITDMMDGKPARRLPQEAINFARKYDSLDEWGKRAVDAIIDIEYQRCQKSIEQLLDEAEAEQAAEEAIG